MSSARSWLINPEPSVITSSSAASEAAAGRQLLLLLGVLPVLAVLLPLLLPAGCWGRPWGSVGPSTSGIYIILRAATCKAMR